MLNYKLEKSVKYKNLFLPFPRRDNDVLQCLISMLDLYPQKVKSTLLYGTEIRLLFTLEGVVYLPSKAVCYTNISLKRKSRIKALSTRVLKLCRHHEE